MLTEYTVRDKLSDGVATIAIGIAPLGFAVALVVFHGEVSTGALVFGLVGLTFLFLGGIWVARKVTFSPNALSSRSWLGERVVRSDDIVSIRIKNRVSVPTTHAVVAGHLVVQGRNASVTVNLGARHATEAAQAWLAVASDAIVAQWSASFAAEQTVPLGRRVRLGAESLVDGKAAINLKRTFVTEEIPAGPGSSALLYVSQGDERIVLKGDMANYLPLRHFLLRAQSAASGL